MIPGEIVLEVEFIDAGFPQSFFDEAKRQSDPQAALRLSLRECQPLVEVFGVSAMIIFGSVRVPFSATAGPRVIVQYGHDDGVWTEGRQTILVGRLEETGEYNFLQGEFWEYDKAKFPLNPPFIATVIDPRPSATN